MNFKSHSLALCMGFVSAVCGVAATHYVDVNSTNPIPPYTNWATAANVIQDAVDAAVAEDTVLVAAGVYDKGGKAIVGTMTNRVAVDKPLTLLSVNGPETTIISGYQVPGTTNGPGAIRCVYLTNGARISGFTLTGGATLNGARGGGLFCDSERAWASNCFIVDNAASLQAGGAYSGTLVRCTVSGNQCLRRSSGVAGLWSSGGGVANSVLYSCLLVGNSADIGGGAASSELHACTVVGNSAFRWAGGCERGVADNSLIYHNHAAARKNHRGTVLNYSCTTPLPTNGIGNIDSNPVLASAFRLSATSPCIGTGDPALATGVDIDGQPWGAPPSMGCDEVLVGSVTGPLDVAIGADYSVVAVGFEVDLTAQINGETTASVWDLGGGVTESNRPWTSRAWAAPGVQPVTLTAYNDSHPGGISSTVLVQVVERPVHYVAVDATNPVPPYSSWATAAASIQDAVDAASIVGARVLVSNGVYKTGGRVVSGNLTNRVVVDKPLELLSVNGPGATVIEGEMRGFVGPPKMWAGGPRRGVWLASDAILSGFTVTNGAAVDDTGAEFTLEAGGGVWCQSRSALVSNCVITANDGVRFGGGVASGTITRCLIRGNRSDVGGGVHAALLDNCVLTGNQLNGGTIDAYGGGADVCTLRGCTVVGNSAQQGGGTASSEVYNSIVLFNTGGSPNYESGSELHHCATQPLPAYGTANITNEPLFMNATGWADLRLQSNSPCINAGNNADVSTTNDLDGNPRIAGGTVDMGAYEFQTPGSILSYAWLQQYGLPTDGSMDDIDGDGDLATTWQEWKAWTVPTNGQSVLRMLSPVTTANGAEVAWQSVAGHRYTLERAADGAANFGVLESGVPGQAGTTTFTDITATNGRSFLYRVGVPE